MTEIGEWSDEAFSNGEFRHGRALPVCYHAKKEIDELIEACDSFFIKHNNNSIYDVEVELADVFTLMLDCARLLGYNADDVYHICYDKLQINKKRAWGKPDKNGVIEHIKHTKRKCFTGIIKTKLLNIFNKCLSWVK